ncbi:MULTISPECIES: esterase-like activity of phytase family protein [unclassified Pseudofrankia]|uniref:esterase-like activity of phytase family protein n=1 Tax=unclassified Pseudofrankia TaxID=2994372 RepID=UPI0008DA1978|nr:MULTISPECIES: esterase-like activity of phytase family protein [unclassified Pseudofrankia]MDT3441104.1 esterase-like activity of phytase family protein [Pseudofrankia sp. BMG5.37]OHV54283.1 3-phytase [Pseudofrankia sp. BMG5.36]
MNRLRITSVAAGAMAIALVGAGVAQAGGKNYGLAAKNDSYRTKAGATLTVRGNGDGLFRNDSGDPLTLVSSTKPAHGTLNLNPDGTFSYTPNAGFTGTDTFTYAVSDAVTQYDTHLPPMATIGGVKITGGAYGSSIYPAPGKKDEFYGVTDRGPNVDGPNGVKVEPMPAFTPAIGLFKLKKDGRAELEKSIPLRAANGTPYSGRVSTEATTGETILDLNGDTLAPDPNGYDPEGLVALPDGTFWISDEYGPYITHFDRNGRQIGRLSPFDGSLPAELRYRMPNRGMEGLTITPDGTTLVGIVQSALQQKDTTAKPASIAPLRVVTYNLRTKATAEYLYLLDDPAINGGAVSEITALSNTTFLLDERDGKFEPGAFKKFYKIDLAGATNVGPNAEVPGATYAGDKGGLLVGADQKTIEASVGTSATAAALATLKANGITPVTKSLYLDFAGLVSKLDPTGGFFGHDKIEGVATTDRGRTLVISNDSDFGISGLASSTAPFQLAPKILPNGEQDDGAFLVVDTTRLGRTYTSTATVTVTVSKK